jgi:uncharacterized Zn finger protein
MAKKCLNCGSFEPGIPVSFGGVTAHILLDENTGDVEHIGTSARLVACRECGYIKSAFVNVSKGRPIPINNKKQPNNSGCFFNFVFLTDSSR